VTAPFARALLGWKPSSKDKLGWPLVPNFADVDNAESMRIGAGMLDFLGVARAWPRADPGGSGHSIHLPATVTAARRLQISVS
jgi:hypothetical protein